MGRYITHIKNLKLMNKKGEIKYNFGHEGVLVVGDATTFTGDANKIDPTNLLTIFATDLKGGTTLSVELVGQGSLNGLADDGTAISPYYKGYRGIFFKAAITSTGAGTVSSTAGIRYKVLTGTVTYAGKDYKTNEIFVSNGSDTATSGDGKFALYLPTALTNECCEDQKEHFKIKKLMQGDESTGYWYADDSGFIPNDSLLTTSADFYGWTRKK